MLQADGVETALVQQCRFLQEPYDSDFASRILQAQGCTDELSSCKKEILKADTSLVRARAAEHPSLKFILRLISPGLLSGMMCWTRDLMQPTMQLEPSCLSPNLLFQGTFVANIWDSHVTSSFLEHVISAHLEEDSVDSPC